MAEHVIFSVESGVSVYFRDPRSPRQRGTSDNTDGLPRQRRRRAIHPNVKQERAYLDDFGGPVRPGTYRELLR